MRKLLSNVVEIVQSFFLKYYRKEYISAQESQIQIRLAIVDFGGRDIRISQLDLFNNDFARRFAVVFAVPSGNYYRNLCDCSLDWRGRYLLSWAYDLKEVFAGNVPKILYDAQGEEEADALEAEAIHLRETNTGKEKLIGLLHSDFRYDRIWGIKLSAEYGIVDGVIVERIRDMIYVDSVKAVRLAAAERIGQLEDKLGL